MFLSGLAAEKCGRERRECLASSIRTNNYVTKIGVCLPQPVLFHSAPTPSLYHCQSTHSICRIAPTWPATHYLLSRLPPGHCSPSEAANPPFGKLSDLAISIGLSVPALRSQRRHTLSNATLDARC